MPIRFDRRALKDAKRLPALENKRILRALIALDDGSENADVRRLQEIEPPEYRLRVGNYRVIFRRQDGDIFVVRILDRKEAYRDR